MRIPHATHLERVERLSAALESAGMDAAFIQGPSSDLQYLMGISREPHNPTDDNKYGDALHGAFIAPGQEPLLLVPRMGASAHAASELAGTPWANQIRVIGDGILSSLEDPRQLAREALAALGNPRRLGVIARQWARGVFGLRAVAPDVQLVDAGDLLARMRMVKDDLELELMRRAAAVTERAFAATLARLELGVTAMEIAQEVDRWFLRLGATGPSFHTGIRISGPGVVDMPAAGRKVGDTPIQPGCVITFDIGAIVDGYASDFGRTVFWGEPVPEAARMHETIMTSQAAAIVAMKSGQVTAAGLNRVARAVIEEAGYGDGFSHRLGHGIGIDVHEDPFLYPGDETTLLTGMCFTIEPSIRVPGFAGVRVEDVVMVSPDGGKSLHSFSRELLVIG